ncbi:hypothetical protein GPECTOR_364g140 [Gonium pectorale]|uniref:Uncharacterized protein n=1 Tax=Gonium pectorale TaxID=33097 RepID=A0A150FVI0_GONPE|nr:hypothetical protein GPECTOR_364g140 [Gonium pectorale]|eukprot:KXZ41609.1 hypothetical protein GPECTOR_364g140 [Gonium pectorale]
MRKCPFLHNIAQTHGEGYASSLLAVPSCPHAHSRSPLLAEDYDNNNFGATFALFHGRNGVLPLPHLEKPAPQILYPPAQASQQAARPAEACSAEARRGAPLFTGAPLASMSMSWGSSWFNIHHLFQQHLQQHRAHQQHHRRPPQQPHHPSQTGPSASGPGQPGGATRPGPSPGGPGAPSASPLNGASFNNPHAGLSPGGGHGAGAPAGGKCPLRRALGPLAGVVFNKNGHLTCPEPIIKMRAALAATRPVRELRPQALPIKLLAVAMTTAALNVPCAVS